LLRRSWLARKTKSCVPVFAVVALLVLCAANADASTHHSSHQHHSLANHHSCAAANVTSRRIAQKIKAFKPGDRQSEARHFDFENYSFRTLDDAARRLFPAGTKMSYVDGVLKGQGKAVKSKTVRERSVHYDYHFNFDRFVCTRTVFVSFDSKTKRVISARGDGQCL
jgi:hypothetical protein